jgi:hypothetical protein
MTHSKARSAATGALPGLSTDYGEQLVVDLIGTVGKPPKTV